MTVATPRPAPIDERELLATAALALYSLAVAFGFSRVFGGWSFLADMTLLVVVGHASSYLLRRTRISGWIAVPLTTALLLWLLLVIHFRSTMTWLVPRGATWDQIDLEIVVVRGQFREAVAPVLYDAGWAALAGFALVITIVMADAFAFRAEARGEALVPGGVLFVFIAALSSARLRLTSTVLLIAAGVLLVAALRNLHDRRRRVELTSARRPASLAVPAALATALAVGVLSGVVGPRIPGADAEPLYNTRTGGGNVTQVLNPLVDIRSRLTNRSNSELFLVSATQPAYWRSTTLAEFDGQIFRQPDSDVTDFEGGTRPGQPIVQRILIRNLGGQLVPAAAEVSNADLRTADGQILPVQGVVGTGAVLAPQDLQQGDVVNVVSVAPAPSAGELRAATASNPPDSIYLELPDDIPDIVFESALRETAGATTPYDQALALEAWLRSFEYSLEVQAGHFNSAIENFLQLQVGYCEQFSATFAAMARTLGIPSRVAVGFTWGIPSDNPEYDGFLSVRGKNAHAWPELWFDGIGWVPFEPTPGRGIPGVTHSGAEPAQDESPTEVLAPGANPDGGVAPQPSTPPTVAPSVTTLPPGSDPTGSSVPSDRFPEFFPEQDIAPPGAGTGGTADDRPSIPWRLIVVVLAIGTLLALPALVRRWRARAARHHGPVERVEAAWTRACSAAERAGVRGRASMTTQEWAAAIASELPVAARPMSDLADALDWIEFAPPGTVDLERRGTLGRTLGDDCDAWALQVSRIAGDTLTPPQRIRHYFTSWN